MLHIISSWMPTDQAGGWTAVASFRSWLLVKVLHPTRQKIGHFGDIPKANLLAWYGKTINLTQQKHTFTNQKQCTTQNKHKKLKPGLGASYNIRLGNRGPILVSVLHKFVTYLLRHPKHTQTGHLADDADVQWLTAHGS